MKNLLVTNYRLRLERNDKKTFTRMFSTFPKIFDEIEEINSAFA